MELRWPGVPTGRPHYESVYCTLVHPSEPRALWIRTTVRKRPTESATGALWVTWFDAAGVRAGKVDDLAVAPGGHGIRCGPATQGPGGSRGELHLETLDATWDLTFVARADPLDHLSPALLYRAPLPRTKATSPLPDLLVAGSLAVDGAPVDLTGWTGMLGHNWGTEHAARWVWLRVCGLGEGATGWLDVILGRVRVGPVLTPWTAFGMLDLDGEQYRLGGLGNRGTRVTVRPTGADIVLTGSGVRVLTRATVALASTVGWEYADPTGGRHEVVNSSVAAMVLEVRQRGSTRTLRPERRGVLELGADGRALDVPLQAYPD
jgi:hypothetical protein